ncbi:hypothetical protein PHYBLDRAFT_151644 [Phycomyces blakesleeanus NRRL 1555(-)]|uniref:Uncharacterized protein n=1 Tax=Phycomyces blakesleeanus (strain ATCC 8743b / DSM 1359 / FGSC 10004 / NBRC 33097 / NRRL 1555) TaxID=763407 RepID=A0A162TID2_PHYB8|nr:hypothetical protein PHYBLDRAFT_151644 [Phycomyces blakesleeanus NRRL 1555(-)]OAD67393.1 hypothetical protein PHYBLDRAFT_151644 [Phycomyces blakesleeanus NRRL 1555(-)]|eukprot:XP_018285433.1 hypothetical protein PHYBLDRAFT_151644 [Phycomyces blakesleeanus NRRL 1555(-)]
MEQDGVSQPEINTTIAEKKRAMLVYFNELDPVMGHQPLTEPPCLQSFLDDTDVKHVLNVHSGHASMTVHNSMHEEYENIEVAEDDDETNEESKDEDNKEIEEVERQVVARHLSAATAVENNRPSKQACRDIDKSLFEFMKGSGDQEREKMKRAERQLEFETKIQSRQLEVEERQIVVEEKDAEIRKRKIDLDERQIVLEQYKIQIDKSRAQIQHAKMLKGLGMSKKDILKEIKKIFN